MWTGLMQHRPMPTAGAADMTAREVSLNIRFTPDEMRHIEQLAQVEGRTRGAMVRRLVDEALTARDQKEKK